MRTFRVSEHLQRVMRKLSKKDPVLHEQLLKKMDEIVQSTDINHYKNLRYSMKDSKRVHVGSFVLIFQHNQAKDEISFDDFDHHNTIYRR